MNNLTNTTIEEIINEFEQIGLINEEAEFVCYVDHIFVYEIHDGVTKHEIQIINDDETFSRFEKVRYLLELEDSFFISHTIYDGSDELLTPGKMIRMVDNIQYQMEEKAKVNN